MNKRQIKKRVKRAKINKERGMILSLEDRHYIRNYGKCVNLIYISGNGK